ncbi:chaplin [Streptomyces griseosporeus]|uniref:chaplin n=1 Tax=Streptomyces griseosporeus TaxID=1910 RepID=UPI003702C1E4
MRRVTRNGMIAVAAASGALVAAPAHADSAADGSAVQSPGLIAGNTVQLPVHLPVNLCGNTVDVVGLLNPAAGNSCTASDGAAGGTTGAPETRGEAHGSPGVVSGNGVQLPVELPVNVSGNGVSVVGVLNPVMGNQAVNGPGTDTPGGSHGPETPTPRPSAPPKSHPGPDVRSVPPLPRQQTAPALASTGTDLTLPAALGSGALILAGATLYRRSRPGAQR